jgi:hypothetical protein
LLIVVVGAVFFVAYTMLRCDRLSDDAAVWASTFIESSPIIKQQLGRVHAVKQITERRQAVSHPAQAGSDG